MNGLPGSVAGGDPGFVFTKTLGSGSLDAYSQALAEHLPGPKLETDVYRRCAEEFGLPLLSTGSVRGAAIDLGFARELRRIDAPLHLANHHLARYALTLRRPYVVTVHDVIRHLDSRRGTRAPLIHDPSPRDRLYLRLDREGIRRAAAVIAVSRRTGLDVTARLGVPVERVHVVYEGIDHERFRPVGRRLLDAPYLLFVGSEHPRKNLTTLLAALRLLKREGRFHDLRLVKVGRPGGPEAAFRQRTLTAIADLGLQDDVQLTDRVSTDDLVAWYSGARSLVLPSLYEGFGFPVLEAMACATPVVVADAGSLPELAAGAAAVYGPPHDHDLLAACLREVLTDERRRAELTARGLARAREFSWQRAAEETLAVYRAAVMPAGRRRASPGAGRARTAQENPGVAAAMRLPSTAR